MTHSYIAYIDESGDDGLVKFREPGADGGSSRWLAISACLIRQSRDLEAVAWRDEITDKLPNKRQRYLHFQQLSHSQKMMAAKVLAKKPVKTITVISNKTMIPSGIYSGKNQLYFYLTRYLIERISWLCRDLRHSVPEGDGRVKIIFSRRGNMSYADFRAYLERLKSSSDNTIYWPVIDIGGIDAQDHSRRAGLQLADIVASSFAAGLELDKYSNCESRYAEILKPTVYERNGNYLSYGMKIIPHPDNMALHEEQLELIHLFK
jgi:hypothetical protein